MEEFLKPILLWVWWVVGVLDDCLNFIFVWKLIKCMYYFCFVPHNVLRLHLFLCGSILFLLLCTQYYVSWWYIQKKIIFISECILYYSRRDYYFNDREKGGGGSFLHIVSRAMIQYRLGKRDTQLYRIAVLFFFLDLCRYNIYWSMFSTIRYNGSSSRDLERIIMYTIL